MCLSRFLPINSGLRRINSRFGPLREFVRNGSIYLAVFRGRLGVVEGKPQKFPVRRRAVRGNQG
jgi:hypothetical protein